MAISTSINPAQHQMKLYLGSRFAKEFRDANTDRFTTTSPYALTTATPTLRIVDNPIIKGKWAGVKTDSRTVRGFFGGVKGVINDTHGGGGEIDTTVQFDRIFLCPVTKREFLEKDLTKYYDELYAEQKSYALDKVDKTRWYEDIATMNLIIRLPNKTTEMISREKMMEILEGLNV